MFSRVDLPQPVGPTTETNSPGATARVASRMAVYDAPPGEMKVQVTCSSSRAGWSAPPPAWFARGSGMGVFLVGLGGELVGPDAGDVDGRAVEVRHRSEEHTSELQSRENLVCRLLLEKKNSGPSASVMLCAS